MAKVGSLLIDLAMNTARLQADAGKAAQSIKRMERNFGGSLNKIERNFRSVTRGLRAFAGSLGIAAGAGGLGFLVKSNIDAADKIQKLSIRLGASTEALSEYRHVAELSGVTFETLTLGWQRMTRRISEAANGTGEARGALKELGLQAADLNRLRPEDQFERLADALATVPGEADRVRLAMKLFDSEGVALIQTMTGGAQGIRDMRAEAGKLGKTITQDMADKAAEANDAMTKMNAAFSAVGMTVALVVAGPLKDFADWFADAIPTIGSGAYRIKTAIQEMFGAVQDTAKTGNQLAILRERMIDTQDQIRKFAGDIEATMQRIENLPHDSTAATILREEIERMQSELAVLRAEEERLREQIRPADRAFQGAEVAPGPQAPQLAAVDIRPPVIFDERYLGNLREQMAGVRTTLQGEWAIALEALTVQMDDMRIITEDAFQAGLIGFAEYQAQMTAIQEEETARRTQIEANALASVTSLRNSALSNLAGFLQTWGQRNKSAAKAAVALQKLMAIAQIKVETEKAAMAAYAWGMVFGGPPAAQAAAAEARAMGALSMGLVAATGLMEIANINQGAGTSTGGVPPSSNTVGGPSSQAPQQQVVQQVIIQGDVYGIEEFEDRVVQANRNFIRREGILIEKNTRQALEFARG